MNPVYKKIDENDVLVDHGIHYHQPQISVDDQEDTAGHRAVYVGVHMPLKHRHHHRHHRHKHRHKKNGLEESDSNQEMGPSSETPLLKEEKPDFLNRFSEQPPQQRVKFILGDEGDEEHVSHEVFTELEELTVGGDGEESWKEMARWIKYEEDVDVGADRWSKPHIATLPLHSLFELRSCLMSGTVCLDMEAEDLLQIADIVLDKLIASNQLEEEKRDQVREALLRKHHHHGQKKHREKRGSSILPMIRSLTDIGRSLSGSASNGSSMEQAAHMQSTAASTPNFLHHHNSGTHLSVDSNEDTTGSRKESSASTSNLPKVASATSMRAKSNFMRKIPAGAEASNVLVGEVDFLSRPIIAFVRLAQSVLLEDLTEVPIPTRFLFIMLGPHCEEETRYHEIGRCIATLMSDEVFHGVAYKAKTVEDLLAGIDEFMDQVTVLPPGAWDPDIRIEPPKTAPPVSHRLNSVAPLNGHVEAIEEEKKHEGLDFTGRPFGGLVADVRRRLPHYLSDYRDSLHLQCVASIFFMYFACITPVITFGGLLGEATDNLMATLEGLLGSAICGVGFALFSGQPLTILGSTGPILIYEKILIGFCRSNDLDYLSFRFWIGLWTTLMVIILVACDASAMVKYFTRFTEESFSSLISFIFIYEAIHKLINIYETNPVARWPNDNVTYECDCVIGNTTTDWLDKEIKDCEKLDGETIGNFCGHHVPKNDVFLMSVLLMLGTFTIAFSLKKSRNTPFFPTIVRTTVSDFSVFLAVVVMIGVDILFGVNTPKLEVPSTFQPTSEKRDGWLVPPFGRNPWWTALAAFLPALLALILIFMDQQITAVIVNRKENKLKKGVGFHLDLLVVGLLLGLCTILGLPWFVAATVLSINHVSSLKVESECKAPGERPKLIGCREQRVTALVVFILIGLATLMTSVLSLIPMPVLYGVFLFMGISSLANVQFVDRLKLFLMPPKHQPDYIYLRNVGLRRVHLFTFIQLSCLVILWVIKSTDAALVFPIMVLAVAVIRKLIEKVFSQRELENLDDVMPEIVKRAKHDQKKAAEEEAKTTKCEDAIVGGRVQLPLAGGNVLTIPVDKVNFNREAGTLNISEEMAKTGIWKALACNTRDNAAAAAAHRNHSGRDETDAQKRMHNMPLKQEKFSPDIEKLPTIDDEEGASIPYRQPTGSISGEITFNVPKFTLGGDSETSV
ncbi:sodium bicarbonate cotransporter 3-like isoform X3 [Patiria miniata]|uniref:Anion exchange protein n=1 Tax=Patiria miniata TaxID=46514 RepID=A0A913Z5R0_PATMI|nr:sodium bicarbonate cotransporter 3-like isoform X3 [Patiria miniata]XP_038047148.1 sodium bicarbonate cotransporter 3-like isoform X3 [Patiria miniata]